MPVIAPDGRVVGDVRGFTGVVPMPQRVVPEGTIAGMVLGGQENGQKVDKEYGQVSAGGEAVSMETEGEMPKIGQNAPLVLQKMSHRHKAVVELALQGRSYVDIGKIVGYTPQAVSMIIKQGAVQDYIARERGVRARTREDATNATKIYARDLLETAALQAAQTQIDLMGSQDDSVKFRSSKEILDKVYGKDGLNPAGSNQGSSITFKTSDGENVMAKFMEALAEAGLISSNQTKIEDTNDDAEDAEFTTDDTTISDAQLPSTSYSDDPGQMGLFIGMGS